MQSISAEMNLSETAFLLKRSDGDYDLRWMTPTVEVDLCGHATLASAKVLFDRVPELNDLCFHSRSGPLTARRIGEKIELDFPAKPAQPVANAPHSLLAALNARALYVGKNAFDYLIELESDSDVRNLTPDFGALATLGVRGVVVTAVAKRNADYDFISRGFFPASGINEDPVTGSAHCMLAPYWQPRLRKNLLTGYQASARGGYVECEIQSDRVKLRGQAVTVFEGKLLV